MRCLFARDLSPIISDPLGEGDEVSLLVVVLAPPVAAAAARAVSCSDVGLLLEEDADLSDTRLAAPPSTTAEDPLGETASPGEALFFTWLSSLFGDVGFTSGSSTSLPLLLSSSGRLTSGPVLFNAESLLFFGGVGRLRFALTFAYLMRRWAF